MRKNVGGNSGTKYYFFMWCIADGCAILLDADDFFAFIPMFLLLFQCFLCNTILQILSCYTMIGV